MWHELREVDPSRRRKNGLTPRRQRPGYNSFGQSSRLTFGCFRLCARRRWSRRLEAGRTTWGEGEGVTLARAADLLEQSRTHLTEYTCRPSALRISAPVKRQHRSPAERESACDRHALRPLSVSRSTAENSLFVVVFSIYTRTGELVCMI